MKKKILLIATAVICLAIIATGTLAYFTGSYQVHNVITSGGVDIKLVEQFPEGGDDKHAEGIMPGDSLIKTVWVENEEETAWIRIKVDVTCDGKPVSTRIMEIDYDSESWIQKQDEEGIWYYKTAVQKGGKTTPLFTKVSFSGANMGNEYQGAELVVNVQAQAVQVANNGTEVLDAKGWPNF